MAENKDEIDELQLRLESQICNLSVDALRKFAQHMERNVEWVRNIQISKSVWQKIESKLEASEEKKASLKGYFDVLCPEPPALEVVEETELDTSSKTNEEQQEKKTESVSKDPSSKINVDFARSLKLDLELLVETDKRLFIFC